MKTALVLLMGRYPNGDAGAVRGHAIAKLLSECGYDVTVIGYGTYCAGQRLVYDGIKYTSLRLRGDSIPKKVISRLTHGRRLVKYIRRNFSSVDLMVVDYMRIKTLFRLEKLAREYGAELYHDSCEWFSKEEFENGKKNRLYKYTNELNTRVISPPWRVISISSYLDEHFRGRGLKSVRIPVIMDIKNMEYLTKKNNEKITFLYAGSPGKKDCLSEMVRAFASIDKKTLEKIEFHIIGVSREGLINVCGTREADITTLADSLVIHGRLPRDKTVEWVRRADFTVLLRDSSLRYTKAGFPTKVVESLASATPVITNLTSDLDMYLVSGENSIIAKNHTAEALARALMSAVNMSQEERERMAEAARNLAISAFDYRGYTSLFE